MSNREDYVVGPGKPPRGTRFKKGQIANPNGRRGNAKDPEFDLGKILQLVDNEKILVTIDGKRTRKAKAEINYVQLFTQALRGKLSAARIIAELAATCFGPEAQSDQQYIFHVMSEEAFEYIAKKQQGKEKSRRRASLPFEPYILLGSLKIRSWSPSLHCFARLPTRQSQLRSTVGQKRLLGGMPTLSSSTTWL